MANNKYRLSFLIDRKLHQDLKDLAWLRRTTLSSLLNALAEAEIARTDLKRLMETTEKIFERNDFLHECRTK